MNSYGRGEDNRSKGTASVITRETFGMTLLLFSVVLLVFSIIGSYILGEIGVAITAFLLGALGYFIYPFLCLCIYTSLVMISGKKFIAKKWIIRSLLIVACAFLLIHLGTSMRFFGEGFGAYMSGCWNAAETAAAGSTGGGVLFGLIVYPVKTFLTTPGAYIIFSLFTAAAVIFFLWATPARKLFARRERPQKEEYPQKRQQTEGKNLSFEDIPARSSTITADVKRQSTAQSVRPVHNEANFSESRRSTDNQYGYTQPVNSQNDYCDQSANNPNGDYNQPINNQNGYYNQPVNNPNGYRSQPVNNPNGYRSQSANNPNRDYNQPINNQNGYYDQPVNNPNGYRGQPANNPNEYVGQPQPHSQSQRTSYGAPINSYPNYNQPISRTYPQPPFDRPKEDEKIDIYARYGLRPESEETKKEVDGREILFASDPIKKYWSNPAYNGDSYYNNRVRKSSIQPVLPKSSDERSGIDERLVSRDYKFKSEQSDRPNYSEDYRTQAEQSKAPMQRKIVEIKPDSRDGGYSVRADDLNYPQRPSYKSAGVPAGTEQKRDFYSSDEPFEIFSSAKNVSDVPKDEAISSRGEFRCAPSDPTPESVKSSFRDPIVSESRDDRSTIHRMFSAREEESVGLSDRGRDMLTDSTRLGERDRDMFTDSIRLGDRDGDMFTDSTRLGDRGRDMLTDSTRLGDRDGDMLTDSTRLGDRDGDMFMDSTRLGERDGDMFTDSTRLGDRDRDMFTDSTRLGDRDGDMFTDHSRYEESGSIEDLPFDTQTENTFETGGRMGFGDPEEDVGESRVMDGISNSSSAELFDSDEPENFDIPETKEYYKPEKKEKPIPKPKHVYRPYRHPDVALLRQYDETVSVPRDEIERNKNIIIDTLSGFSVDAEVVRVTSGPSVTRYDIDIPKNIFVSKVTKRSGEIAMRLHAKDGVNMYANNESGTISIEVPNSIRATVGLASVMQSEEYLSNKPGALMFAIGKDIEGRNVCGNIPKMTHILVAGTTNAGKSVCLNAMIISLICKYSPEDLRLILIDPKKIEFSVYEGLPHLMINEIIADAQKAIMALNWAIKEMERRYELFDQKTKAGVAVRNIDGYNSNLFEGEEKLPKIVFVVDELADLMSVAKKDIEERIQRLTQKARAAGIHLVLATQRPSVDVITGVIKGNLPTRMAVRVIQEVDSRTILDESGAEKLLGMGDMLFKTGGMFNCLRVQVAFIDDSEVQAIVEDIKSNNESYFDSDVSDYINRTEDDNEDDDSDYSEGESRGGGRSGDEDPLYVKSLAIVVKLGSASISLIQRKCGVGYNHAGKIMEWMEDKGYVSPFDGKAKARTVLLTKEEYESKYGPLD